jgi:hypothetical protein
MAICLALPAYSWAETREVQASDTVLVKDHYGTISVSSICLEGMKFYLVNGKELVQVFVPVSNKTSYQNIVITSVPAACSKK